MMEKARNTRFFEKKVHLLGLAVGVVPGCSVYAGDHCANLQGNSSCEGRGLYCSACQASNDGCTDVFPSGSCYFPGGSAGADDAGSGVETSAVGGVTWGTAEATVQDGDATSGGGHGEEDLTSEPASETETSENHPVIVISDGEAYDFGAQDVSTMSAHVFTVSNEGDGFATSLDIGGLSEAFEVQDSDCETILAPGSSCDVAVGFNPVLFGEYEDELEVSFVDVGMDNSVSRPVFGLGVGLSSNLLVNGDAEQGGAMDIPPVGWSSLLGGGWVTVAFPNYEGDRSIYSGPYNGWSPNILYQAAGSDVVSNWGDVAGVRFYYRAYHRSWFYGDDATRIQMRFLDTRGRELEVETSDLYEGVEWNESWGEQEAPRGTSQVLLDLICEHNVGDHCNGYFDSIGLWAEWSE